jgi:hypothetical protein
MTTLHIADTLPLPTAAATEALGFLGRRGSGKTYAAQKLAEEFHRIGAQFVVLDPVGNWWALRLAADGKSEGLPVPVFGGLHGDIPLEPTAGKLMADVVVDRSVSAVIDVSQFESDADKARFATDFAARFFYRKKAAPSAVHLFLEECQEFIPQNPQREETRMLHAFTRIGKLGRNFGIGISMLSQRPQEVNKKVLNLTELLFCFQLTGPQERKTIEGWIAEKGIDEDIAGELPKLKRGQPHAWSPAWLDVSKVVAILPKSTYDASSTPKVGAKSVEPKPLAPIDLERIRADMAATIEKAKQDDPAFLRKRIAELERAAKTGTARTVEKPVIDQAAIDRAVASVRREFERQGAEIARVAQQLVSHAAKLQPFAEQIAERLAAVKVPTVIAAQSNGHRAPAPKAAPARRVMTPDDSVDLPIGERAILTAIAQHDEGVTRDQLSVLTGYKRSSRDAYLQRLRTKGYLNDGATITATDEGIAALGSSFEPLPTGDALRDYWMQKLPEGERRLFEVVVAQYPSAVDRDTLSDVTEYKRSSRDAYLQRLKSRRLITADRGTVRASDTLFT